MDHHIFVATNISSIDDSLRVESVMFSMTGDVVAQVSFQVSSTSFTLSTEMHYSFSL